MESNAVIPQGPIDVLKSDPSPAMVKAFDRMFGEGSARAVLRESLRGGRIRNTGGGDTLVSPANQTDEGGFWSGVGDALSEAPRQVVEKSVRGVLVSPSKLLAQNFGDIQHDFPVTFFDENGGFSPHWTGFNWRVMSSDEFNARTAAGEKTGLDAMTDTRAETTGGQLIGSAAQFVGGLAGFGKIFRIGKGLLGSMSSGAAVDFLSFEGDDGRLVDALSEMGVDIPEFMTWLQTDDNDSDFEGRLKNAIEGMGIGVVAHGATVLFRGLRSLRRGNKEEAAKLIQEGLDDIEAKAIEADDVSSPARVEGDAPKVVPDEPVSVGEPSTPSTPKKFSVRMTPQQAKDIRDAAIIRSNQPLARRPDVGVNLDRVVAQQEVVDLMASQRDVLKTEFDRIRGGDVQTWSQVKTRSDKMAREMARMIGEDPEEFAKRVSTTTDNPVDMAADLHARWNVLMTIEDDLGRLGQKIERGEATPQEEILLLQRQEIATNLFAQVQGLTTNVARAMSVLRMVRQGDSLLKDMMDKNVANDLRTNAKAAARAITEARKKRVLSGSKGSSKVPPSNIKAATEGMTRSQKFFHDLNTYRINAMLSGPGTQEVNFLSNAVNLILLPAEQAIGGAPIHAIRTYIGMLAGAREAIRTGLHALWNEQAYLDPFSSKFEVDAGRLAHSKDPLAKLIRMPGRLMISADEMFKQAAYRGRVYADALVEAKSLNLSGKARNDFVKDYIKRSFDDEGRAIRGDALLQAQRTTFTEGLDEGSMRTLLSLAHRHPWLRIFVPFIRTPINILSQSFQHLPGLGIASKRYLADIKAGGVRRSQAIGRQMLGTAITIMGLHLAFSGQITGSGPSDPRLRKVWLQNNRPYSFRWRGEDGKVHHWSYQRLEPLSSVVAIMADLAEIAKSDDDRVQMKLGEAVQAAILAISENTVNKTFTQGISDLLELLKPTDDGSAERSLASYAASFVPNIIPQLENAETIKEVRGFTDAIRDRIGLDGLDPRRNILGEIVYRPGARWDPLGLVEGDIREHDPVLGEIERLGRRFGSSFDVPRTYTINGQDIREIPYNGDQNQSLYDRKLELTGTIKLGGLTLRDRLSRLMRSRRYQQMQDGMSNDNKGPRYTEISRWIRKYRDAAERQLLRDSKDYKELKRGLRKARIQVRRPIRSTTFEERINE